LIFGGELVDESRVFLSFKGKGGVTMPVCDLCNQEKEEVFKPNLVFIYAKDKDVSQIKLCKECIDFLEREE
jgi:hypothetical protein